MGRRRLLGIRQEPIDLVNITLNSSNIGVLKLIVNGKEYPYIKGGENVHSVPRGTIVTFKIDVDNPIIDYFEFSTNTSNTTHEGNNWNVTVEEDISIKGYAGISNVDYYDSVPEGFETYMEWYNQLPFGTPIRKLTLIRSFKAGYWATICLPFSTDTRGTAMDGYIYIMSKGTTSGSGVEVLFTKTDEMKAGTPYMFFSNKEADNPYFEYVELEKDAKAEEYNVEEENVYFVGVLNTTVLLAPGDDKIRYMSGNKLYYPSAKGSGITMPPNRAYFRIAQ